MNKKVFAFDMDGTILKTDHVTFNPSAIEAVREAQELGHKAIIATGRSLGMITPLIVKNKIEGIFDYIVCNNGSYTYDVANDKIITFGEVPNEESLKLLAEGEETESIFCAHSNEGTFICSDLSNGKLAISQDADRQLGSSVEKAKEFIENHLIVQASIRNTKEAVVEIEKGLDKYKNVDVCIANEEWIDLNPVDASKLSGLGVVSKLIDVPIEDFVAFGDSGNDIEMLKGAGTGVAMGNGNAESKEIADVVIGDCNSDAIATFIREMVK